MGALHKGDLGTIKTMCFVLRRGKVTNEDHDLFSILRAVLFFVCSAKVFLCRILSHHKLVERSRGNTNWTVCSLFEF